MIALAYHVLTLADGTSAKIDARDWPRVRRHRWRTHPKGVIAEIGPRRRRRYVLLHRLVMRAAPGQVVLWRNGDFRDCRRDNLVVMTKGEHNRSEHRRWRPRAAHFCGGFWPVRHRSRGKIYHYWKAQFRGRATYHKTPESAEEWVQGQRARDGRPLAIDVVSAVHGEGARLDWSDRSRLCAAFAGGEA